MVDGSGEGTVSRDGETKDIAKGEMTQWRGSGSLNAWEVRASLDAQTGGRGLVVFPPHRAHGGGGQKRRDSF